MPWLTLYFPGGRHATRGMDENLVLEQSSETHRAERQRLGFFLHLFSVRITDGTFLGHGHRLYLLFLGLFLSWPCSSSLVSDPRFMMMMTLKSYEKISKAKLQNLDSRWRTFLFFRSFHTKTQKNSKLRANPYLACSFLLLSISH